MADFEGKDVPELGFWEKADLLFALLSVFGSAVYAAVTGVFRGKSSPRRFSHHITTATVRKSMTRMTDRQRKYICRGTSETYTSVMQKKGLQPHVVSLPHGAGGHWLGNKNATNVLVYYHGGGYALPAVSAHFEFYLEMVQDLNNNGRDTAVFFTRYSLTPYRVYPMQLRQAVEALRYVLNETGRSPSNVIVGGDSAGGNLALATLLHLSHPHPDIEAMTLSSPLAGVFGHAPWINFSLYWPSMVENAYKDIITPSILCRSSEAYLNGKASDSWSEPDRASTDWWKDVKTERLLIMAGTDEILLSSIESFAKKLKAVFPDTTYIVGYDESHVAPVFADAGAGLQTQTGRGLRQWIDSCL